jgi:hypothetical protein
MPQGMGYSMGGENTFNWFLTEIHYTNSDYKFKQGSIFLLIFLK